MTNACYELSLVNFNCNGLKGSLDYVSHLVSNNDIVFICEHWLRQGEFYDIRQIFSDSVCYLKSSIKSDTVQKGRPYGGLGFVCKKKKYISYKSLDVNSDRISVLELSVNNSVLFNIIGVYLPYNDQTSESLELFLDIIDKIDSFMDNSSIPTIIVGDFNTTLPQISRLTANWYRQKPFNRRSVLMYDFICDHKMIAANFAYKQQVNFTYQKGETSSYIDHVIVPQYLRDNITQCEILCNDKDNVSDHFAIKTSVKIELKVKHQSDTSHSDCFNYRKIYPKGKWDNKDFKRKYSEFASNHMKKIPI